MTQTLTHPAPPPRAYTGGPTSLPRGGISLALVCASALGMACDHVIDQAPAEGGGLAPAEAVSQAAPATLADSAAFYNSQPRHLRPIPLQQTPAGLPDVRAATCGACHTAIYEEWKVSTHARAWLDDAQFQAELHKNDGADTDVRWMCVNCHTPLENQLPRLVAGLESGALNRPRYVDNPAFDQTLQLEAITCATCHVRDGVVLGPYGDSQAPHPVKRDDDLLGVAVCVQCHQAQASFPEINLSCAFGTGEEWAASPQGKAGQTCQSCHMPEVTRALSVVPGPERATRRHWFGGSLIPKKPEYAAEVAALQVHYPDGLTAEFEGLPDGLRPGEAATVKVSYTNAQAGHRLPTGDPERFILVELSAMAGEQVLATSTARLGTEYQWWPQIKKLSDNRLMPKESRALELSFTAPETGDVQLRLTASKWRISEQNLGYHKLEGVYPAGRVFLETRKTLPVR